MRQIFMSEEDVSLTWSISLGNCDIMNSNLKPGLDYFLDFLEVDFLEVDLERDSL